MGGSTAGTIVVAGGTNIDIGGQSQGPLAYRDSNPGTVTVSLGGVGRNIAHNLRLLGAPVCLLTALGEDAYAQELKRSCQALGIDLTAALGVPGGRTSTYVFLNDHRGDMALAVSDMALYDQLTPDYFAQRLDLLNAAALVVVDTNLPKASLDYLAQHCTAPLFADPVSTQKAAKLLGNLGRLHTIKPNRLEAELLSGVAIEADGKGLERAAQTLLDTGLQRVFITLGPEGTYAAQGDQRCFLPALPAQVRNATGGGDAFMAGLAWAYLRGASLQESAQLAAAASTIAVEGVATINPALSPQAVEARRFPQQEEKG